MDRPMEPYCSNESPEQWAEVAQWESDRADAAEAGLNRLRKAIETHRRNVWGSGPVGHDEDAALYAALELKR